MRPKREKNIPSIQNFYTNGNVMTKFGDTNINKHKNQQYVYP